MFFTKEQMRELDFIERLKTAETANISIRSLSATPVTTRATDAAQFAKEDDYYALWLFKNLDEARLREILKDDYDVIKTKLTEIAPNLMAQEVNAALEGELNPIEQDFLLDYQKQLVLSSTIIHEIDLKHEVDVATYEQRLEEYNDLQSYKPETFTFENTHDLFISLTDLLHSSNDMLSLYYFSRKSENPVADSVSTLKESIQQKLIEVAPRATEACLSKNNKISVTANDKHHPFITALSLAVHASEFPAIVDKNCDVMLSWMRSSPTIFSQQVKRLEEEFRLGDTGNSRRTDFNQKRETVVKALANKIINFTGNNSKQQPVSDVQKAKWLVELAGLRSDFGPFVESQLDSKSPIAVIFKQLYAPLKIYREACEKFSPESGINPERKIDPSALEKLAEYAGSQYINPLLQGVLLYEEQYNNLEPAQKIDNKSPLDVLISVAIKNHNVHLIRQCQEKIAEYLKADSANAKTFLEDNAEKLAMIKNWNFFSFLTAKLEENKVELSPEALRNLCVTAANIPDHGVSKSNYSRLALERLFKTNPYWVAQIEQQNSTDLNTLVFADKKITKAFLVKDDENFMQASKKLRQKFFKSFDVKSTNKVELENQMIMLGSLNATANKFIRENPGAFANVKPSDSLFRLLLNGVSSFFTGIAHSFRDFGNWITAPLGKKKVEVLITEDAEPIDSLEPLPSLDKSPEDIAAEQQARHEAGMNRQPSPKLDSKKIQEQANEIMVAAAAKKQITDIANLINLMQESFVGSSKRSDEDLNLDIIQFISKPNGTSLLVTAMAKQPDMVNLLEKLHNILKLGNESELTESLFSTVLGLCKQEEKNNDMLNDLIHFLSKNFFEILNYPTLIPVLFETHPGLKPDASDAEKTNLLKLAKWQGTENELRAFAYSVAEKASRYSDEIAGVAEIYIETSRPTSPVSIKTVEESFDFLVTDDFYLGWTDGRMKAYDENLSKRSEAGAPLLARTQSEFLETYVPRPPVGKNETSTFDPIESYKSQYLRDIHRHSPGNENFVVNGSQLRLDMYGRDESIIGADRSYAEIKSALVKRTISHLHNTDNKDFQDVADFFCDISMLQSGPMRYIPEIRYQLDNGLVYQALGKDLPVVITTQPGISNELNVSFENSAQYSSQEPGRVGDVNLMPVAGATIKTELTVKKDEYGVVAYKVESRLLKTDSIRIYLADLKSAGLLNLPNNQNNESSLLTQYFSDRRKLMYASAENNPKIHKWLDGLGLDNNPSRPPIEEASQYDKFDYSHQVWDFYQEVCSLRTIKQLINLLQKISVENPKKINLIEAIDQLIEKGIPGLFQLFSEKGLELTQNRFNFLVQFLHPADVKTSEVLRVTEYAEQYYNLNLNSFSAQLSQLNKKANAESTPVSYLENIITEIKREKLSEQNQVDLQDLADEINHFVSASASGQRAEKSPDLLARNLKKFIAESDFSQENKNMLTDKISLNQLLSAIFSEKFNFYVKLMDGLKEHGLELNGFASIPDFLRKVSVLDVAKLELLEAMEGNWFFETLNQYRNVAELQETSWIQVYQVKQFLSYLSDKEPAIYAALLDYEMGVDLRAAKNIDHLIQLALVTLPQYQEDLTNAKTAFFKSRAALVAFEGLSKFEQEAEFQRQRSSSTILKEPTTNDEQAKLDENSTMLDAETLSPQSSSAQGHEEVSSASRRPQV